MNATKPVPMPAAAEATQDIFQAKCDVVARLFEAGAITELVSMFYAPTAILEGKGLPPQCGLSAITQTYQDVRRLYPSMRIELDPVTVVGNVAFGTQKNLNLRIDGQLENHRGLMVWHKIEGEWRIVMDFFYTDHDIDFLMSPLTLRDK